MEKNLITELSSEEEHPQKFEYMLLSRLQADCEYYLGFGGRFAKHLWALDERSQIEKMKELHTKLTDKPEWLTFEKIEWYEKAMIGI